MKGLFIKLRNWLKEKEAHVFLEFFVVSLLIFSSILKPGFVFALDLVFVPEIKLPTWLANDFVIRSFFYLLNFILPSSVIEKSLLFLIVILSGAGMYKLIETKSEWPRYFAGIFYIFNPFFYERLVSGQFFLLLAYALLPWAIKSAIKFFNNVNRKQSIILGIWLGIFALINLHSIIFFGLFLLIYFLVRMVSNLKFKISNRQLIKYFFLILLISILINSFWLSPIFFDRGGYLKQLDAGSIGEQLEIFKSKPDPLFGLTANILSLYGFWGEGKTTYLDLKTIQPFWPVLSLIIFILFIWGLIISLKKKENKSLAISLLILSLISFLMAISTNFKIFHPFFKIIFLKIFRDPQKFVSLLVLSYAFFGAWAIDDISRRIKNHFLLNIILIFALVLPLFNAYILFGGLKGQFFPVPYPKSWNEINEILNRDKDNFKALFFPWHSYMSFSFVKNKLIANPAQCPTSCFFDKPVITSNDMEAPGVFYESRDSLSHFVTKEILTRSDEIISLGELIKREGIKYIILAEEVDFDKYDFLDKQIDLKEVYRKDKLRLYKNLAW